MRHKQPQPSRGDSGQVTMMLALMMGIFLMAFVGFATDYTNFWFQRQSVQSATDSTCQAAAVDLLLNAASFASSGNFTPGATAINCSTATTAAPCMIAKYNGYDATRSGTLVSMTFPTSLTGVTPAQGVTWPFVTVNTTQQAPAYFSSLVTHQRTQNIHASATCGLTYQLGAGSLLVLRPYPQITTFTLGAGSTLNMVGGSPVGIQINADSVHATSFGSGSSANLSTGGTSDTGSDFAVTGQQSDPGTTTYARGTTGQWLSPDLPVLNPFLGITPPSVPGASGTTTTNVKTDGCPLSSGCTEYGPGNWPSGITVGSTAVAIFKPGLYYMGGDLTVPSGATVRNAILSSGWNSHYGVFFYFTSGKPNITATNNTLTAMASTNLTCNASSPPAAYNIPSTLNGNVLFAPCTTDGLRSGHGLPGSPRCRARPTVQQQGQRGPGASAVRR